MKRQARYAFMLPLVVLLIDTAVVTPVHATLGEVLGTRERANVDNSESQQHIDMLSEEIDEVVSEYRRTLDQTDALRIYNTQLDHLIADQESEMTSLREQIDQVVLVGRGMIPLMIEMIEALEKFVKLDVPFLPDERSQRLEELRDLINRSDVSDAERYRRILEAYQIENEYGRTIEAYRGTMQIDGEGRTVDFLRVGRVALIYQTLGGGRLGVWNQAMRSWEVLPESYRMAIERGLRIARKQTAPDLIELPIPAAAEVGR